jgi:hypothetical protein
MRPALHMSTVSRSSSGLGHRPFTAVTGVRVPYGMPPFFVHRRLALHPFQLDIRCLAPHSLPFHGANKNSDSYGC